MIIQNRTISVTLTYTQEQTSKKAHKILISQNSIEVTIIGVARGGSLGDPDPPPNRNATNDKNVTKNSCVFIFNFFQHLRVLQSRTSRTTVQQ